MGTISPSFVFDLKTNIQGIVADEYARLTRDLWWQKIAKTLSSTTKKERITWLLSTATLEEVVRDGGSQFFEDVLRVSTEYENKSVAAGLKLKKEDLEDLDGGILGGAGLAVAAKWASDIGKQAAYWPQAKVAEAILANPTTYDTKAFFATDHPVNPLDVAKGTFRNDFTGGSSGIYPGAVPIGGATTAEAALDNLGKAIAYIRSIKMPNGINPRGLRVNGILVPPALAARATQLTGAKFIAQSAASGALSGDVEAVVNYLNLGVPIVADELGSAFTNGSDSTYYLLASEITGDQLGAFTYVNREPFNVNYVGPETDAQLAVAREFQWTANGRNVVGAGHPYMMFRCQAT